MEARTKMNKDQVLKAIYEHVWTNMEEFVKTRAQERTIANLGEELGDYVTGDMSPERAVEIAFNRAMGNPIIHFEDDDFANDVMETYRSMLKNPQVDTVIESFMDEYDWWLPRVREEAKRIQEAGLPLTLANAQLVFEHKGPFAGPFWKK
jgi:hypothetical protein